jgi:hypothetical protein
LPTVVTEEAERSTFPAELLKSDRSPEDGCVFWTFTLRSMGQAVTGIRREDWLFTRGSESVRLVREEDATCCRLFVYGPGTEFMTHEFANVTECMKRQAEIEQRLLTGGYHIARRSADRRSADGTQDGSDHRSGVS